MSSLPTSEIKRDLGMHYTFNFVLKQVHSASGSYFIHVRQGNVTWWFNYALFLIFGSRNMAVTCCYVTLAWEW